MTPESRCATPNWAEYVAFIEEWWCHPGFDWCLIPDKIDGDEKDNDALLDWWQTQSVGDVGVPVWHLHESLDRLRNLVDRFPRVAIGSSGEFSQPNTGRWWSRMSEAMPAACFDDGRPRTKLHGLRQMDPTIFSHIPYSSVDSSMIARSIGVEKSVPRIYRDLSDKTRALVFAERIERHASANRWTGSSGVQKNLELIG